MKYKIAVLGGPNLDKLGSREPEIYGSTSWRQLEGLCDDWAGELGVELEFLQTNGEGDLVQLVHETASRNDGIILNAAAYTHTSVAVRDAVSAIDKVVELHLTNPYAREPFRKNNLLADVVTAGVNGFGPQGYRLALSGMVELLKA